MARFFKAAQFIMRETTPFESLEESLEELILYYGRRIGVHLDLLFMTVERILDILPSETADMLRLDHFSSWYTDRLYGDSPYEDEFNKSLLNGLEELDD